ncbi:hypothetical protein EV201_3367 [Ancylomarina subtilis]|uniref:Uncharacterized protein n=1 Tax=Ancylomarina subtilis TaxID=1639035 RepID=A0A4Q7V665_9BACT|nr:hypothetical protein [Ancylomarina subtilis]RZT91027.1 hypothetical protein EV201_3367 [Ancylomarina subtilis]
MENIKSERIRISLMFLVMLIGFMIYVIRQFVEPVEMTIGVFNTVSVWIAVSLLPVLIPLLYDNKAMKILTLIFGGMIMLIDIALPLMVIIGNEMNEPITWGIIMVTICCVSGLIGMLQTLNWIKTSS